MTPIGELKQRYKLTERQARFVQAYIATGNGAEAVREAEYKAKSNVQAARLLAMDSIKAALEAERAKVSREYDITVASVAAKLAAAYDEAMARGQVGAAVQAAMGEAKLAGLLTDKVEQEVTQRSVVIAPDRIEDDDQWMAQYAPKH